MSSYTESIEGNIAVFNNNIDAGLSGQSPDWGGGKPASFAIYWRYPGGFTNTKWPEDFRKELVKEIITDDITYPTSRDKQEKINEIVYSYGKDLLSYSKWDDFNTEYGQNYGYGCVQVL